VHQIQLPQLLNGVRVGWHARVAEIVKIGKESNHLEEVDAGLIHSADNVYTVYPDQTADHWERVVMPLLNDKHVTLRILMQETGLSRRMLINAKHGYARPHRRNQELIIERLQTLDLQIRPRK
jgi:hypothetical protein